MTMQFFLQAQEIFVTTYLRPMFIKVTELGLRNQFTYLLYGTHLVNKYRAIISEGEEADDLIAKEATRHNNNVIVASVDKDMLQIPCWHYNFSKREWKKVSKWEGLKFFYTQILTGDRGDNIIGLWKVGPVGASKILKPCNTESDLWNACLRAYDGNKDRVI